MKFYVYEHRRLDTGAVFYVGKGTGQRSRVTFNRNRHWRRVAERHGWSAHVVCRMDDEDLAFLAEVELIDLHRRIGSPLTNVTDGGGGTVGYRWPADVLRRRAAKLRGRVRPLVSAALKGRPKSEEHRRNLAAAKRGTSASPETRAKMSQTRKGRQSAMLGKKHRPDSIEKIRAAVSGERNPFFGKTHPPEVVARIIAANTGRRDSAETRLRKSEARLGEKNPRFGVPIPDEQKARQIATLRATIAASRRECEHCGKSVDPSNFKRWHGDACRERVSCG